MSIYLLAVKYTIETSFADLIWDESLVYRNSTTFRKLQDEICQSVRRKFMTTSTKEEGGRCSKKTKLVLIGRNNYNFQR